MNLDPKQQERCVQRIVRRVIREGRATNRVGQRILSLARQEAMSGASVERDSLVTKVSHRICDLLRSEPTGSTFAKARFMATELFFPSSANPAGD